MKRIINALGLIISDLIFLIAKIMNSENLAKSSLKYNPYNVYALTFIDKSAGGFKSRLLKQLLRDFNDEAAFNLALQFGQYAFEKLEKSNSQIGQDLLALWANRNYGEGLYFCEFGAMDGIQLSNTLLLEKQEGWKGILVEPMKDFYEKIMINRNCNHHHGCITAKNDEVVELVVDVKNPEFSSQVKGSRNETKIEKVKSITLESLLENFNLSKNLGFLSVDTEGTEYEILKEFNFKKYHWNVVVIEHNFDKAREEAIDNLLISNGYIRIFKEMSLFDSWYIDQKLAL